MSRAVLRALAPGLAALSMMASAAVADEPLFRFRVHDRPAAEHDAGKGNRLSDHRAGPAGDLPRRLIRKRARKARRLARIDRGLFIVDRVVGKHEYITYAVGINTNGTVNQIEILQYSESYGYEVRKAAWCAQFVGKSANSALRLNGDIKNISGATLSSKHVTDAHSRDV